MKLIAHRGLTQGPDKALENSPNQIIKSLKDGFDCEIDVWYANGEWWLGHDLAQYQIDWDFLKQPGLWIHAKNLMALHVLGADHSLNFFWHQEDDYTLTSQGYIWTYPNKQLTDNSVMVMPEWRNPKLENLNYNCFGICSDYVERIKSLMPSDQNPEHSFPLCP